MLDFIARLFSTEGFPPRWYCGEWTAAHGWLHILSDLAVWSAYFAIPCILAYFVLRRRDVPFTAIFWLFGAFILACGTTHLMEAIIFWQPVYRLAGLIKLLTALVSWVTVIALVPVIPMALAMRSPEELEREIAARRQAEENLQKANAELETKVAERTRELAAANAHLAHEREMLRTTLTSIGDGVVITDVEGRVTFLNPVGQALTGWTHPEALGQPLTEVFRIVNEQTRQPVANPVLQVLAEGNVVGLANHTVLIARDGTERPIDDSAAPIKDAQGKLVGVVLIFRDVTERRKAEKTAQALASIVESSEDAIIGKDVNGNITSWNGASERLFGYSAEEVQGRPITILAPPERIDEMPAILTRIRHGERIVAVDTIRRAKDGKLIPISLTVSPIKDEVGRIIGVSKICRDISERKRTEMERERLRDELAVALANRTEEVKRAEKAEQQLRDADRRKDEFLATLAHELRNPLAPLMNSLALLQHGPQSSDDVQEVRGILDRQVKQLVRLVDDLLDVSRITRGKLQLRPEHIELAAVLNTAVEMARPLIDKAGHELTVMTPPEPVFLDADPVRLAQVFANLLNNAVKYTNPRGCIWLTAEQREGEVVVSVRDNGMGILPEHLPHLFTMFSQVTPALERTQGGLGIGLALVKGLVELHGGTVEAQSAGPGQGSEFTVRLPILEASPPEPDDVRSAESGASTGRPHRILVVDDNRDAANTLVLMLRMMGHETAIAFDGFEALEVAAQFRPEIVFLDIGMPKLSGYEAARRLRQEPWGAKITLIALTGWGQEKDKQCAGEAGFDRHLTKPVPAGLLEHLLAAFDLEGSSNKLE